MVLLLNSIVKKKRRSKQVKSTISINYKSLNLSSFSYSKKR